MSGSHCYLCLTEITDNRKKVKLNGTAESGLEIREFLTCVLDEFYEADYETTTLYEREAFLCTKCVTSRVNDRLSDVSILGRLYTVA